MAVEVYKHEIEKFRSSPKARKEISDEVLDFMEERFSDENGDPITIPDWKFWKWLQLANILLSIVLKVYNELKEKYNGGN